MSKGRFCNDNWQENVEVLGKCHFAGHKSNMTTLASCSEKTKERLLRYDTTLRRV